MIEVIYIVSQLLIGYTLAFDFQFVIIKFLAFKNNTKNFLALKVLMQIIHI